MKNSVKGALLSALIFPGVGHLALKRYPRGIAFILTSTIAMIIIVAEAVKTAFAILEKIDTSGEQITREVIVAATNQAIIPPGSFTLNAGLIFLSLCWIIGVIDAYRIGKSIDSQK